MKRGMLVALTWLMLIVCATTAIAGARPSVTGIHPNAGPLDGGNIVTITGSGFAGVTDVEFGNTAVWFNILNDFSMQAQVPQGLDFGPVDVTVTSATEGTTTNADLYKYVPLATISSVSPSVGSSAGGTTVTITGSYFTGAQEVDFGNIQVLNPIVNNDNQITVIAPPGTLGTTADVSVINPAGRSIENGRYTWGAKPLVSSVSPNSGSTTGGNSVTITGTYFTGTTSVKFGNTEATSFNVVNANKIIAVVPAGTTGKVHVQVTAIGPSTATSNDYYTYVQVPIITGITPTSGSYLGGNTIDILGYGFTEATTVIIGNTTKNIYKNVPLSQSNINSDSKITIDAPKWTTQPGAPVITDIQVITPGGASVNSSRDQYTYIAAPKIYSLSPTKGPTDGGTVVTINGIGLTGTSKVTFDGWYEDGNSFEDEATITSVTDTQVKILTPQEDAGPLQVVVTSTGGISSLWQQTGGNVFTYTGLPVVNSIAPIAGPTTGGTKVTITGGDLKEVQKVMFGPNAATAIKVVNPTKIIATSPAGTAGTVDVTVVSPSGTSPTSDNDKFTYQPVNVVPTVTKVAPKSGIYTGGNTVTVYGSGFTGATLVNFGSKSGSNLAVTSDTKLTVTAPAGTGTVDLTVVTPGGASPATSKDRYTYLSMPVVSSVSPTSGPVKGGNTVMIYGTNFKGTKAVYFGNMKVTKLSVNNAGTRVTLKAPAGIGRGTVDVTVLTSVGKSATSTADKYIYV